MLKYKKLDQKTLKDAFGTDRCYWDYTFSCIVPKLRLLYFHELYFKLNWTQRVNEKLYS